jgi:hypothetical protein
MYLINIGRIWHMSPPSKRSPTSLRSLSGPASRVASTLKDAHVLAIELPPDQRHLEPSLIKALDLLASFIEAETERRREEKVRRLGELLVEDVELPKTAVIEAEMRANVIRHLITKGKWLTAADIAKQGGYSSSNSAEPANRWKRERKIFAINFKGQDLFAAYQFDPGMKPRRVIAEVLKIFKDETDPWRTAAWFAGANGWLGGKPPQDCLDQPERVLEAAHQEVTEIDV